MRENYLNYKDMDAPPSMSEEAEKLFMECTRNYEARMNGLLHNSDRVSLYDAKRTNQRI